MKINKRLAYFLLATLIFLGAVVIRTAFLSQRINLTWDTSLFNIIAYKHIFMGDALSYGPYIDGVNYYFPSTFYIMTTAILKATNFSYYALPILTVSASLLALLLILVFFPKLIGVKGTLITAFLFAFSEINVNLSLLGTNLEILPPLIIASVICLVLLIKERRVWLLIPLALMASLMTLFHATGFFFIAGVLVVLLCKWRLILPISKSILPIVIALLVVLIIGLRPHYLENKAFGGTNIPKIFTALVSGSTGPKIDKLTSIQTFISDIVEINGDLLVASPLSSASTGYSTEQTKTALPSIIAGVLASLVIIVWLLLKIRRAKFSSITLLIPIIFLIYLLLQAILPTYIASYEARPTRWLTAVYFPLFFITLGIIGAEIIQSIKNVYFKILFITIFGVVFSVTNILRWNQNRLIDNLPKLKTTVAIAKTIKELAKNDDQPYIFKGNGDTAIWNFALSAWKQSGDKRFLRQFIWNVAPKQNQNFYVINDEQNTNVSETEKDLAYAKSLQNNPQILEYKVNNFYEVKKVYNQATPSVAPTDQLIPSQPTQT